MRLLKLSLIHFKNVAGAEVELSPKFTCFVGDNGAGKTSLLDAVHYLSVCKSFLNPHDSQNITHRAQFCIISGSFEKAGEESLVSCSMKREGRKQFRRDRKEYQRLIDHVGIYPTVVVSPTDSDILHGGSEERRRFIDSAISQTDRSYLESLTRHNRVLQHRNALLKAFLDQGTFDAESIAVWDMQLTALAHAVHERRRGFLSAFVTHFSHFYRYISGTDEEVGIAYESHLLTEGMETLLGNALPRDRAAGHTTVGIHKDDLLLTIAGHPLKRFASQGQQKSALVALRLAQYAMIREATGLQPILLLDDIFDRLDEGRVERLLELVSGKDFGQALITDTHPERSPIMLQGRGTVRVYRVSGGGIAA